MAVALSTPREPVTCARPGCKNTFTPKHGRHKFCSAACKHLCHNYRFALAGRR